MHTPQRFVSMIVLVVACFAALVFLVVQNISNAPATAAVYTPRISNFDDPPPPTPAPGEIMIALYRCGLTPENLAAAGVAANEVATIVSDVSTYLTEYAEDLTDADLELSQSRALQNNLRRLVQSGQGDQGAVTAYASATTEFQSAKAALDQHLANLFAAATDSLDEEQIELLQTIRGNQQWGLPTQYLVVNRTNVEWLALRDALAVERISKSVPSPAVQSLLQEVRGDVTVATAAANLTTNTASISTSMDAALAP